MCECVCVHNAMWPVMKTHHYTLTCWLEWAASALCILCFVHWVIGQFVMHKADGFVHICVSSLVAFSSRTSNFLFCAMTIMCVYFITKCIEFERITLKTYNTSSWCNKQKFYSEQQPRKKNCLRIKYIRSCNANWK